MFHSKILMLFLLLLMGCGFLTEPDENSAPPYAKVKKVTMVYDEIGEGIEIYDNSLIEIINYKENGNIWDVGMDYTDTANAYSEVGEVRTSFAIKKFISSALNSDSSTIHFLSEIEYFSQEFSSKLDYYKPTLSEIIINNISTNNKIKILLSSTCEDNHSTDYYEDNHLIFYFVTPQKMDTFDIDEDESSYTIFANNTKIRSVKYNKYSKSVIEKIDVSTSLYHTIYSLFNYTNDDQNKSHKVWRSHDPTVQLYFDEIGEKETLLPIKVTIDINKIIDFVWKNNSATMYVDSIEVPLLLNKISQREVDENGTYFYQDHYIVKTENRDTIKYVFNDKFFLEEVYIYKDGHYAKAWGKELDGDRIIREYNCSSAIFFGKYLFPTSTYLYSANTLYSTGTVKAITETMNRNRITTTTGKEILRKEYHYREGRVDYISHYINDKLQGNLRYYYEFY